MKTKAFIVTLFIVIAFILVKGIISSGVDFTKKIFINNDFKIISSVSNKDFDAELKDFAKDNKIDIDIDYYGDLEIIDLLNSDNDYDAVWISNSIWLYMLDNQYLVTNSKSIGISPVVFGIKQSKAEELEFTKNDVYNKDILDAIKKGNLKYVMPSVTKTNSGMTAYLGFLNSIAGSPEVLTSKMLESSSLEEDMVSFFKGVERVSGDEDYTIELFKNGDYDALISYESSLIELNKELARTSKETLYLIYPEDGVAINDMPFGYVNRNQGEKKEEQFNKIQKFLLSKETQKNLEKFGKRTWYGGINSEANKDSFKEEWGIDTTKYLIPLNYPSKAVMTDAINLYVEGFRKPTHTVFCLDISGSMDGNNGLVELKEAMEYVLSYESASKDKVQFSKKDKVSIILFDHYARQLGTTKFGSKSIEEFVAQIKTLKANGGTNIYDSSLMALKILEKENKDNYNTAVILMTDGMSNNGTYNSVSSYVYKNKLTIPIYSIMFGKSDQRQLQDLADLTNGKIFDGKAGLKEAFTEVRGYN